MYIFWYIFESKSESKKKVNENLNSENFWENCKFWPVVCTKHPREGGYFGAK